MAGKFAGGLERLRTLVKQRTLKQPQAGDEPEAAEQELEEESSLKEKSKVTAAATLILSGGGNSEADGTYIRSVKRRRHGADVYVQEGQHEHRIVYVNNKDTSTYKDSTWGPAWYVKRAEGALGIYIRKLTEEDDGDLNVPLEGWEAYSGRFSLPGREPAPEITIKADSIDLIGTCWDVQTGMQLQQVSAKTVEGSGQNEDGPFTVKGNGSVMGSLDLIIKNADGYLSLQMTYDTAEKRYVGHTLDGGYEGVACTFQQVRSAEIIGKCWGLQTTMHLRQVGDAVEGTGNNEHGPFLVRGIGSLASYLDLTITKADGQLRLQLSYVALKKQYVGHMLDGGYEGRACTFQMVVDTRRKTPPWIVSSKAGNFDWWGLDEHLRRTVVNVEENPRTTPRNSLRSESSVASSTADAWTERFVARRPTESFPELQRPRHHEKRHLPWQDDYRKHIREKERFEEAEASGYHLFRAEAGIVDKDACKNVWDGMFTEERDAYAQRVGLKSPRSRRFWQIDADPPPLDLAAAAPKAAALVPPERLATLQAASDRYHLALRGPPSSESEPESVESVPSVTSDLFSRVTGYKWKAPAELRIRIGNAYGIMHNDRTDLIGGEPDTQCVCSVVTKHTDVTESEPKFVFKTKVAYASRTPVWNEMHTFDGYKAGNELEFKVIWTGYVANQVLGKARLNSGQFFPHGFSGDVTLSEDPNAVLAYRGTFVGMWLTQHGTPVQILSPGDKIRWESGNMVDVTEVSDTKISAEIEGATYIAELRDGKLCWDDGDVWSPTILWEGKWLSTWPNGKTASVTVQRDGRFEVMGREYQLDLKKKPVEFKWITGEKQHVLEAVGNEKIVWQTSGRRRKGKPPRIITWERKSKEKGTLNIEIVVLSPVIPHTPEPKAEPPEPRIKFQIFSQGCSLCVLTFRRSRMVRDIKRAIFVTAKVAELEQRLFLYGIRELLDHQPLRELPSSEEPERTLEISMLRRTAEQIQWFIAIRDKASSLLDAPLDMRLDKNCVLAALRQEPQLADIVADELGSDRHFFRAVVGEVDYPLLKYASEELRSDREVVLKAVKGHGASLQFASDDLRDDLEIVQEAVKKNAHALRFASDNRKADRETVLLAVEKSGYALGHAALHDPLVPFLVNCNEDKELVQTAMQKDDRALRFAGDGLWDDVDFARQAKLLRQRIADVDPMVKRVPRHNPRPKKIQEKRNKEDARDIAPRLWDAVDADNMWTRRGPESWGEV